jgi:hypothetical protein
MTRRWVCCLLAAVFLGAIAPGQADDEKSKPPAMDEKEKAFAELLTDATLAGEFTVERPRKGDDPGASSSRDRYTIKSVKKVGEHKWLINSQIVYGKLDVTVPVAVEVHWADDTPVLCVTDLTIPLVGSGFTTRLMFYDGHYAGTWKHGKVGGLMYGRVEHSKPEEPATSREGEKPAEKKPAEKP